MSSLPRVKRKKPKLKPEDLMRPDGRPEVYEVTAHGAGAGHGYVCFICQSQGHHGRRFNAGEIFMSSPVNTPGGEALLVCLEHLPENVVIFDPHTNKCRDKSGQNVWEEKPSSIIMP